MVFNLVPNTLVLILYEDGIFREGSSPLVDYMADQTARISPLIPPLVGGDIYRGRQDYWSASNDKR